MSNVYLIKDLSKLTGYSVYTLKYYLNIGLIEETSRSPETGFRYFDDSTITQLRKIHSLRLQKKSLKEIRQILTETQK